MEHARWLTPMADIVGLLLPFFGLILVGYVAARVTKQPAEALGWLNTFIIYAALPAKLAADIARKVLLHPFILSTALGFVVAALSLHQPLAFERFVNYLAQAAAPCALFAMGVTLALRPLKRIPVEIGYIVPAKLILHPLVVYIVLQAVGGFDPIWIEAAVLLAALPTATNVFVIGQQYGVWQERASATILITTACSVVTVSLVLYLIKSGVLPAQLFP
jgi:predicted permease